MFTVCVAIANSLAKLVTVLLLRMRTHIDYLAPEMEPVEVAALEEFAISPYQKSITQVGVARLLPLLFAVKSMKRTEVPDRLEHQLFYEVMAEQIQ